MAENYKNDIRFKQGRKLLQENKFEEAIEFFSSLLQSQITLHGEQTLVVAPLWFEYGRALLMKEQENPTDDLLGAVAEEAKKQAKVLSEELNVDGEGEGEDGEDDEEEEENEQEGEEHEHEHEHEQSESKNGENSGETEGGGEDASDMEVAWEALEVARKILENEQNSDYDLLLSEIHESLGDIHRFNGNFSGAIDEYKRSLDLREAVCEDHDRLLAQAYYSLAVAHIYLSGDIPAEGGGAGGAAPTPEAILALKKTALRYYGKAKEVLLKSPPPQAPSAPPSSSSSTVEVPSQQESPTATSTTSSTTAAVPAVPAVKEPLSEAEERKELCDEISETITALEQEIKSAETPLFSSSSSSSSSTSAQSNFIGAMTTTIGFGQANASSSIPMLEVKRKSLPSNQDPLKKSKIQSSTSSTNETPEKTFEG